MPKVKVLVVDDVETNLDVACALLRPYGFTVDCVTSGLQALALLKSGVTEYDCIFMDHMMPDMDGLEVVKIIREQIDSDYARNVPIVAMTANALLESEKLFLRSGFQAYIPKPIDLELLHEILTHWIRDRLSHIYPVTELNGKDKAPNDLDLDNNSVQNEEDDSGHNGHHGHHEGKDKLIMSASEIVTRLNSYYIDGLDLVKGLARYEGKESIYIPLLRSFVRHTPLMLESLKNPTEENLANYAIKVHGLKGACAGICANKVSNLALAQEMAAKKPDLEAVLSQNEDFISAAEMLIRELGILLRNFPTFKDDKTRELKITPDITTLEHLSSACQSFKNSEIQKNLKSLEAFEYQEDSDLVDWLREQADNIEYDAMVERLVLYISDKKRATVA
jgi:CheY-like chemotaxis protein